MAGIASAKLGALAVTIVAAGLGVTGDRDLGPARAEATPTPFHQGQPSSMASPSAMEPTRFPLPEPTDRPTADMMAQGGAAMIAAAEAMDDAAEVMARSDDPSLIEKSGHWREDALALRERGAWMVMTATSAGMVHDPDRAREIDVWNLKANGVTMVAEGEAMAAHGREMLSEAMRLRDTGALPPELADDLITAARAIVDSGESLRRDGERMERYADGLIQSLGMRP